MGHDKMRIGADLRIRSLLVSINHVTDPLFVTFSSSLHTTIRNPNPNLTLILILLLTYSFNPNPKHNATVFTDRQIGPIDPQIVTVLIRSANPLRSAFRRVPILIARDDDVAMLV